MTHMTSALVLPTLVGDHVVLRAFVAGDAPLIVEVSFDPVIPLITSVPAAPTDTAAAVAFIQRQHERARTGTGYSFAITDAGTGVALGHIGLWPIAGGRASIGYWVAASARRRGIATAALRLVTTWAMTALRLDRLELYVEPWNKGSWRTAELAGYTREGLLRSWERVGDERRDMYMYSCVSAELPAP